MQLEDVLKQASHLADKAIIELDNIINKALETDLTIPEYEKVRNSAKDMYTHYSFISNFYNDVNQSLLKANQLMLSLSEMINQIANSRSIQFQVTKEYLTKFKALKASIKEKIAIVSSYKTSLEFIVKFYSNILYMFNTSY